MMCKKIRKTVDCLRVRGNKSIRICDIVAAFIYPNGKRVCHDKPRVHYKFITLSCASKNNNAYNNIIYCRIDM